MPIPYQRIMAQSIYKSFIRKADPLKPPGSELAESTSDTGHHNDPPLASSNNPSLKPFTWDTPADHIESAASKMKTSFDALSSPPIKEWKTKGQHPLDDYGLDYYHGEPVVDKTANGKPITNKMLTYDSDAPHDPHLFHDNIHSRDVDQHLKDNRSREISQRFDKMQNTQREIKALEDKLFDSHTKSERDDLHRNWEFAQQQLEKEHEAYIHMPEVPYLHPWQDRLDSFIPGSSRYIATPEQEQFRAVREKELQNRYNKDKELHENKKLQKIKTNPIFQQWRGDTEDDLFERALRLKNGFGVILKAEADHPLDNYEDDKYQNQNVVDKTAEGQPITEPMRKIDPNASAEQAPFQDRRHAEAVYRHLSSQSDPTSLQARRGVQNWLMRDAGGGTPAPPNVNKSFYDKLQCVARQIHK